MHVLLGDDAIESVVAGRGKVVQIGVRAHETYAAPQVLPGRIGEGVLKLHMVGLARNSRPRDPNAGARA